MRKAKILARKIPGLIKDITGQITVAAVANVYTLNIGHAGTKKFKIETTDTNAKTITLSNPALNSEIVIKLKYTSLATINAMANVTWKDGVAPSYNQGKTYFLYLITDDGGANWLGAWTGAW